MYILYRKPAARSRCLSEKPARNFNPVQLFSGEGVALYGQTPLCTGSAGSTPWLFRHFTQRDAQRLGDPLAVVRGGLQALADVANLNHLRRIAHRPGGVFKEDLLLRRTH